MRCFLLKVETTNGSRNTTMAPDSNGEEVYMRVLDGHLYVHAETFADAASVVREGWIKSIEYVGESVVAP